MSALTTKLSLYKPGGGLSGLILPDEIADIDRINSNMDILDANIGFRNVTSGTRPISPYDGEPIYETDTQRIRIFNNAAGQWLAPGSERGTLSDYSVADLDGLAAITDMIAGDTVVVRSAANWTFIRNTANSAWAQNSIPTFATAAARDTEYAKAAGVYKVAGVQAFVTAMSSLIPMIFNGVGWQKFGLVKPSAAATTGGAATINDDGSVTFVSTGAGNVILTYLFMPTALYDTDNFDVEISYLGAATSLTARLCTAGVPDVSGANHDYSGTTYTQAGVVSPTTSLNAVSWPLNAGISGIAHEVTIELRHAGVAAVTRAFVQSRVGVALGTSETGMRGDLGHRLSTIYDGLQLIVTAAGTVTAKVKPRS